MISKNQNLIRVQNISYSSSVDGEGFRDVLFVNYCPHHCEGCHNPETWDEAHGKWKTIDEIFEKLTMSDITDVTFSGGEPFCQCEELTKLAKRLNAAGKTVWSYTGYLFEDILKDDEKKELLMQLEVLVDGPFVKELKEENLRFKGSTNQRIIDVQKSLKANKIILWED